MPDALGFADPSRVTIGGVLGDCIEASRQGRLKYFIQDKDSEAIAIYRRDVVVTSESAGWKGECAGKWLYTAARCARRTRDETIIHHLRAVADFLIEQQEPNGYLGTFTPAARFCGDALKPRQSFDLWMNGYVMQGLMQVYLLLNEPKYLAATKKIADLCIETYAPGRRKIVNAGPFGGMASASVLEHFVDLFDITREQKYLDFAAFCLEELERRPGTELISRTLNNYDAAQISEGKMYEMIRCYVGAARLYQADPHPKYRQIIENAWMEIRQYHENAAGAPCGGVAGHRECFNLRYTFSPYTNSETCAMMEWLRLNLLLLSITGEAQYAEQLERIAFNALPGAQFPDGYGWTYHSVMNGLRERTDPFACCSSSGAMALEEIPASIYAVDAQGIRVNLYCPSEATLNIVGSDVRIQQRTNYPFDGRISITVEGATQRELAISFRIPAWVQDPIRVNGQVISAKPNTYYTIRRVFKPGESLEIEFPLCLRIETRIREYNEKGEYLDGATSYHAIYRGPLLYATERKDTFAEPNPLRVKSDELLASLSPVANPEGDGSAQRLQLADQVHLFVPYYQVCRREPNSHHAVWLQGE